MTANSQKTELPASGREVNLSAAGQLGNAARPDATLRVVSMDGSTGVPFRPELSPGTSPPPIPSSSGDVSTPSGPLDLSYPPAGLELPKPAVSLFPQESDGDARAASHGSAQFKTSRPSIGLESRVEGKTDSRSVPAGGGARLEASFVQAESPSSVQMKRTGFDARLARTIDAWPSLPMHVRETIVTIIDAALNG